MAYGDTSALEMEVSMIMRITVNGGTDVTLDQVAEEGSASPAYTGSGAAQPAIATIDLNGAGPRMPAANGPERYLVTIKKLR